MILLGCSACVVAPPWLWSTPAGCDSSWRWSLRGRLHGWKGSVLSMLTIAGRDAGVRRGLKLLVPRGGAPAEPLIEAGAGDPENSNDGAAEVEIGGTGLAVAQVQLSSCGDRECRNPRIQLCEHLTAGDLPQLVSLLHTCLRPVLCRPVLRAPQR